MISFEIYTTNGSEYEFSIAFSSIEFLRSLTISTPKLPGMRSNFSIRVNTLMPDYEIIFDQKPFLLKFLINLNVQNLTDHQLPQ